MNLPKGFPHHAYCILGETGQTLPVLFEFLKKEKVSVEGNPDFYYKNDAAFGIDDVRILREQMNFSASGMGRRIAVIVSDTIRIDAQNALLKIVEEPPQGACIFLLIDSKSKLLPTLCSRLVFVEHERSGEKSLGKEFLKLGKPERLEYVKKLLEAIKNEKKTKNDAVFLFDSVFRNIAGYPETKNRRALEHMNTMRQFLEVPGASLKMLLESLCVLVD